MPHLQEWFFRHSSTLGKENEPDSNLAGTVVPEALLIPPRHWVTAVPTAGVAGALCLAWQEKIHACV